MKIESATFVISNTDVKKCPSGTKPEYAFIGRSNVGKSSLINAIKPDLNLRTKRKLPENGENKHSRVQKTTEQPQKATLATGKFWYCR